MATCSFTVGAEFAQVCSSIQPATCNGCTAATERTATVLYWPRKSLTALEQACLVWGLRIAEVKNSRKRERAYASDTATRAGIGVAEPSSAGKVTAAALGCSGTPVR